MNDRELALSVLCRMELDQSYSNIALSQALEECGEENSRALITQLVYGTLERRYTLDYILAPHLKMPVGKLDSAVRNLLRMAVYQFYFLSRVPESAACNEAVELAKRYAPTRFGFVNGVLRSVLRAKQAFALPQIKYSKELSVVCSVSQSLARLMIRDYGLERALSVLSSFFEHRDTDLCVNTTKISSQAFFDQAKAAAIPLKKTELPNVYALADSGKITQIPGFAQGQCYVQDRAAYVCACGAKPKPGDRVLDLCAAPGGKSFTCGVNMGNVGRVDAYDVSDRRMKLMEEGVLRLGLTSISLHTGDAVLLREALREQYDLVLCDVPCSGLGIIGKKPEIRFKEADDFAQLPNLQSAILRNGGAYTKRGGTLFYSTCTLNKAENEKVVDQFLHRGGFRLLDLWQDLPEHLRAKRDKSYTVTLFPDIHGTDGFFMAKFLKL